MEKQVYTAPETEVVAPRCTLMDGTIDVHWSEENEGEIEANSASWDEEETDGNKKSVFQLWDED